MTVLKSILYSQLSGRWHRCKYKYGMTMTYDQVRTPDVSLLGRPPPPEASFIITLFSNMSCIYIKYFRPIFHSTFSLSLSDHSTFRPLFFGLLFFDPTPVSQLDLIFQPKFDENPSKILRTGTTSIRFKYLYIISAVAQCAWCCWNKVENNIW